MHENNTETTPNHIFQNCNNEKYIRTALIKINSNEHKEAISAISKENRLIGRILEKCDIEIFNDNIIVLKFPRKSIYSEQAFVYLEKIKQMFRLFKKFQRKKFQVIPYVALLKDYKKP